MNAIPKLRKALGPIADDLSDAQIEEIGAQLDKVADAIFEWWLRRRERRLLLDDSPIL